MRMVGRQVSESTGMQERVSEGPMSVALLDEIAERLLSLEKLAKAEIPEGIVEPIEKYTVTSQRVRINARKPWFSISLINDGPDSVFAIVNSPKSFDEHEVLVHETYTIYVLRAKINDVLLRCNDGETAHVRLVGVR